MIRGENGSLFVVTKTDDDSKRGFILEYSGFEHPHILTDGGFKAALFSGTTIYILAPLHLERFPSKCMASTSISFGGQAFRLHICQTFE
jgi:hypothetical protein